MVQKTMLVSACYRALGLMDSKRMFIRITTWVFPPSLHAIVCPMMLVSFCFLLIGNFLLFSFFFLPRARIDILTLGQGLW